MSVEYISRISEMTIFRLRFYPQSVTRNCHVSHGFFSSMSSFRHDLSSTNENFYHHLTFAAPESVLLVTTVSIKLSRCQLDSDLERFVEAKAVARLARSPSSTERLAEASTRISKLSTSKC